MDLRMLLTPEGANYLREWADVIPIVVLDIIESTEKVISVYQSVSDNVGSHRESFYQMLINIKKAQEDSVKAILELPVMLRNTADRIDRYCGTSGDGTHTPPVKKLTLHR